jgi:hypothetical protein
MNPDFRDLLAAFNARGVEFLVVGAYALDGVQFPDAWAERVPARFADQEAAVLSPQWVRQFTAR